MSRIRTLYEPFRHWQESSNIYIISDTHFADDDRTLMGYPNEREQVKIINHGLYGKRSTLIHLGDVGNPEYMKHIKAGRKILIKGNHDVGNAKYEPYFDEIYEGALFIHPQILLSHEPISIPFGVNIHGHDHSNIESVEFGINLAGNVVGFEPLNLNDFVNNGGLKNFGGDIHRLTIDKATENSIHKEIR